MIIKVLLLVFAIVVFALIAFTAIDKDIVRWEAGAFAAAFAAFLPWPEIRTP